MVGVVASTVLGAVFLAAGGTKVAAGRRWRSDARSLAVPHVLVPIVPWLEIGLGAVLVSRVAPRPAAAAALVVVFAFSAVLARRLAQVRRGGVRPMCACFGAFSSRPISWRSLARNAVIAAVGVVAVVSG